MNQKTFGDLWVALIDDLFTHGEKTAPRGLICWELRNVQITAPLTWNVLYHPQRKANYRFMVAEWLWVSGGYTSVSSIARYNSKLMQFSDDGHQLYGAYGPQWVEQREGIWELLRRDPQTRQAVVQIWRKNPPVSKDIPCTLTWQFLVRDHTLHMTVNMRSSDVWWGLTYDWFVFSQIANELATSLGYDRGELTMNLASSHFYETMRADIQKVLRAPEQVQTFMSPSIGRPSEELYQCFLTGGTGSMTVPSSRRELGYARALLGTSTTALEELIDLQTIKG